MAAGCVGPEGVSIACPSGVITRASERASCVLSQSLVRVFERLAHVRVLVDEPVTDAEGPLEAEPVSEATVLADIAWATGRRFDS
jgi:hypothetical protein